MYKYCDSCDQHISLHDCHATHVSYENGVVTFAFSDGIWITKEHPNNALGKTVRSDKAEVKYCLDSGCQDDITLYVFERRLGRTVQKEWPLSKLMEYVNNKKYTLEFLYRYKGDHAIIIECWLWSGKKPYHRECELKIWLKDVTYCWNELCEEKEW